MLRRCIQPRPHAVGIGAIGSIRHLVAEITQPAGHWGQRAGVEEKGGRSLFRERDRIREGNPRFDLNVRWIGYAQDEWKIKKNLTMSYGLRYEFYSVLREARGLGVLFNATTGQIMPSGTPWYGTSKNNWGPRLAFTWSPEKLKNKTVLRIGAGYYYGPGQTEDQIQPIDSDRASVSLT